jgi:CubicO group peptidase (beta-lactamase class C family)
MLAWMLAMLAGGCDEELPYPASDPWQYAHPSEVSLSPTVLAEMHSAIQRDTYGQIHSVLIVKAEKIVYEHYYNGYSRDDLHSLDAVTKSVVSTLLGSVMRTDSSISVDQVIIDLLPQYGYLFDDVPQKDRIRIRDLMSNVSGLWWEEWDTPYSDPGNDATQMQNAADWSEWVLSKPMIREPGFVFKYNSGNAILMGPVVERQAGQSVEEAARQHIFEPLGIKNWNWDKTGDGSEDTAWGLHLRTVDIAKIGYLFVRDGKWNGTQVFDEAWIRQSTRYRSTISNYFHYAYQWWRFSGNADIIRQLEARGMSGNDVFFAWGRGDQMMLVLPSFDMVVVITAGNPKAYQTGIFSLLMEYIVPSLQSTQFYFP